MADRKPFSSPWARGAALDAIAPATVPHGSDAAADLGPPSRPLTGLPLGKLIPLRAFWDDRSWRTGVPLAFLALAGLPFVFLHLNFGDATWGFALYFAGIWFFAIRALVKPEAVSKWRLASIAVFTVVVGIPFAIGFETQAGMSTSYSHYIFGVGLPEEFAKALPVFLFVYLAKPVHPSPRTYLFLGAVSGLALGAVEAVQYSTSLATVMPYGSSAQSLTLNIWRLVSDPVMHACWAGISCFFIGVASIHHNKRVPLVAFGLATASVLHGVYDTTANTWMGAAVMGFSLFVFVGYVLSAERIARLEPTVSDLESHAVGPHH